MHGITKRADVKLLVTFLIIYLYFAHWVGWNENSRLALTRAIVEDRSLNIDRFIGTTGDRAFYKGSYYSDKAPGVSLLSVAPYKIYQKIYQLAGGDTQSETFTTSSMLLLTFLFSCLPGALCVVLVYKILKEFNIPEDKSILAAFAFGLGTPFFHTSIVYFGHTLATLLGLTAFYNAKRLRPERNLDYLNTGLLAGFAVTVEYTAIILTPLLLIFLLKKDKTKTLLFFPGFIAGLLPAIIYNLTVFGSIYPLGYFYVDKELWTNLAYNQYLREKIQGSIFYKHSIFTRNHLVNFLITKFVLFDGRDAIVGLRLLFGPYRGLFFYNPLLLLSIPGLILLYRKNKAASITILLTSLLYISFNIHTFDWWGGLFYGPRHLTTITPFLMIPLAFIISRMNKRILVALILVSTCLTLSGLQNFEDEMRARQYDEGYNALTTHFIPLTLQNGPRSRLLENLYTDYSTPIEFRDNAEYEGIPTDQIKQETILLNEKPIIGSYIELRLRYLSLLPLLILLLIWKDNTKKVLASKIIKRLLVLTLIILLTLVIDFNTIPTGKNFTQSGYETINWFDKEVAVGQDIIFFDRGWWNEESKQDNSYRWMRNYGKLYILNTQGKKYTADFLFYGGSFKEERTVRIFHNNKKQDIQIRTGWGGQNLMIENLTISPGLNTITLYPLQNCDEISENSDVDDKRCLTIYLQQPFKLIIKD